MRFDDAVDAGISICPGQIFSPCHCYDNFIRLSFGHPWSDETEQSLQWLGERGIPFSIIFTKADKLKPKAIDNHIEAYKAILLESWEEMPNYFVSSSTKNMGKEEVLGYIDAINKEITS